MCRYQCKDMVNTKTQGNMTPLKEHSNSPAIGLKNKSLKFQIKNSKY